MHQATTFTAKCVMKNAPFLGRYLRYLAVTFLIRNFRMHYDKRRASIIRRRFLQPHISSGKRRQSNPKSRKRERDGESEGKGDAKRNEEHVGQINMVDAHVPKRTRVGGLVIFGGDDFSKSNVTKRSYYKFHSSTRSFPLPFIHPPASLPLVSVCRYVA